MGYYNFLRILKYLSYHFSKIFKYLAICLVCVTFITVCLLLFSTSSRAETADTFDTGISGYNGEVYLTYDEYWYDYLKLVPEFNGDYYMVFFNNSGLNNYNRSRYAWFIAKDDPNLNLPFGQKPFEAVITTTGSLTQGGQARYIKINNIGSPTVIQYMKNADTGVITSTTFTASNQQNTFYGQPNNGVYYYCWGSRDSIGFRINDTLYDFNLTGFDFEEDPYIALPHDSTDDYVSGEFADFMIIGNDFSTVYFFLNDGSVEYGDNKAISLVLDTSSPYYLNNYTTNYIWIVPKNILGGYYDGHIYNLSISWIKNEVWQDSEVYSWTTSFSEQAIINDQERYQNELNGFLMDGSYNSSSIINNMPNSDDVQSPTDDGIDNIFQSFYNAFTTDQVQSVRFVFPNSNNQYIDIPSNIVSSKIPQPILIIIQSLYWFLICRYIIKDIASTAEKAKSGDILDSTDSNIKTDLL